MCLYIYFGQRGSSGLTLVHRYHIVRLGIKNALQRSLLILKLCNCYLDNYAEAPLKISESPASSTAIVEHLYSFPHAVPSSICKRKSAYSFYPPKSYMKTSSLGIPYRLEKSGRWAAEQKSSVVWTKQCRKGKAKRRRIGVAYVVTGEVVNVGLRKHGVVCLDVRKCSFYYSLEPSHTRVRSCAEGECCQR